MSAQDRESSPDNSFGWKTHGSGQHRSDCVVVGVDGSHAALNAVKWAAAEAVDRDVPLRMVHAVPAPSASQPADPPDTCLDEVLGHAENAARQARRTVRVQPVRVLGAPAEILVCESRRASLVCLGCGPRQSEEAPLFGATMTAVAQDAACPVAIIRSHMDGTPQTEGVISVVLSDEAGNDDVVHTAMHEGRLRGATVRQIDQRTDSWVRKFPDVHVEIVTDGSGAKCYRPCDDPDPRIGLAVVGPGDAAELAEMRMPNCHPIHGYPACSVLVVR